MAGDIRDPATEKKHQRPGWLIPVVVLAGIALVAGAAITAAMIADDEASPQEVVVASIEAYNARDIDALEALFDPDIVVTYDGSKVGFVGEIPDEVGREMVLEATKGFWDQLDSTITYEVLAVDDQVVTTSQTAKFPDGSDMTRHTVVYQVSDEGLIVQSDHVIEE